MLVALQIRNYAIIREAMIRFDDKLNIITGETGAGKSILMGALGLILGERADTRVLMNNQEKCIVEGHFNISGYALNGYFKAHELDYDNSCIIRREIAANGKSRAFINDTPVSLQQLKELGASLVDIVSQHETLALNERDFQLSIVDAIAGNQSFLTDYTAHFHRFRQTERELKALVELEQKARQDEDYFRFMLNELLEAKIEADEQPQLEKDLALLSNAEQIRQATSLACDILDTNDRSVSAQLRGISNTLSQAAKHYPLLDELVKRLNSTGIELKDIASELEAITEKIQADPAGLMKTEERLQLLFSLQKKHRVSSNTALLELQLKLEKDIHAIGSLQEQISGKEQELKQLETELRTKATALSARRNKAIPGIEKNVNDLLRQVQMGDAKVKVDNRMEADAHFTQHGIDHIELLFAANKGSSFSPVSKVASGGELSRLMLCIKSLISDKVALPSIVFDEIDTGISGEAALKVAGVMKQHAAKHQVIAITHLPQIAGKADAHFYVYKVSDKNATNTLIKKLDTHERVEEIARMLHGENPSEKVLDAAKELIG